MTRPPHIDDLYELSPLQQGMLFHSLSSGEPGMYVAQRCYRMRGPLDRAAVGTAWRDTLARHTALRTSFHWDVLDKPLQAVHREVPLDLSVHDWSDAGEEERRRRLDRALEEDRRQGFALTEPPLMRLALVRLGEDDHWFVWTHHMMLLDGWSVPLVTREVFTRYAELVGGQRLPLPEARPYGAYVGWLQERDPEAQERFWRDHLAGHVPTPLPGDRGAAGGGPGGAVGQRSLSLGAAASAALRRTAAGHRVTVNTVVQAAWALALSARSGRDDVVFGMTSSGRPSQLRGVESMVGLFINTVPMRLAVPGDLGLGAWLRRVQETALAVREHEHSPLTHVRRWGGADPGRPLFESVLVFENYPVPPELRGFLGELRVRQETFFERTSEPLTVLASDQEVVELRLLHHRDRLDDATAARILAGLEASLRYMAEHPGARVRDIPRTGPEEREQAVHGWNGPVRRWSDPELLHTMVEERAAASPDAVAVRSESGALTYAELDRRANGLAHRLAGLGVGPDSRVGVCAHRSPEMVVALLGVLKAGGAYVPLDPELPALRLGFMVEESDPVVVLAQDGAGAALQDTARVLSLTEAAALTADAPPRTGTGPDHLAYVMYTSGSTGRPKGVMVSHRAVRNRLLWMRDAYRLAPEDRVLQKTPFSFDVSVWEFFWPLVTGAGLVLARPGGHRDARYLVEAVNEWGVTTLHFVPSMLRLFLEEADQASCAGLRQVFCSGEQLAPELRDRFLEAFDADLHNLYGPTEAAVDVTAWDCRDTNHPGTVPIGRPVDNTVVRILDSALRPAPIGAEGELCVGGPQLARGYLNRPELTERAFVPDPFLPGERLYRTGDLARYLPDGAIEFRGRTDDQVKIRGNRIEPGEIARVAQECPGVGQAVVTVRETPVGARLCAHLTPDGELDTEAVRSHLRERLPAVMVPADLVVLDSLPLTANGKLDRAALPDPLPYAPGPARGPAPEAALSVASVFAEVLGVPGLGADDDFFTAGGDSFAAIRATRSIPGASVTALFRHPTARALAAALESGDGGRDPLLPLTPERTSPELTLVCVPYGGGNPGAYRPLARALPAGVAVQAVDLPGHDLGRDEPPQALERVAEDCAARILERVEGPVAVYGHCIGVALAVEIARRLEEGGRRVERVLLGASFPFTQRTFLGVDPARILPFEKWETDQRVMRYLRSLGGFEEVVSEDELAFVMRNFRHDGREARRYLTARLSGDGPRPLRAPITFVAGTDDPETGRYRRRYRAWAPFGSGIDLAVIPGGGHYFLKHDAEALAAVIAEATGTSEGLVAKNA